jgi:hypothetical protein
MAPRKIEHFSCQQPKFNDTLEASNENDLNFEDTELADQSGSSKARKWIHKTCTTKLLKSRLPCLQWIPEYTLRKSFHDFIAGLTVALTAIPQGIAYGAVAGLPVEVCMHSNCNNFHLRGHIQLIAFLPIVWFIYCVRWTFCLWY